MKTNLTILFLFVLLLNIQAQNQKKSLKLNFVTSLDFNMSKKEISGNNWGIGGIKYDKTNYRIGLNTEYGFNNKISFLPGILYSKKDFTGAFVGPDAALVLPLPQRIELKFIEIPLALKFYLNPQKLKLYGLIGINNQFNLTTEKNENINQYVDSNTYSVGVKAGGGIEYKTDSKIIVQLFSDYNKGLSSIFKDSNYKLDYLSLGAGITIII